MDGNNRVMQNPDDAGKIHVARVRPYNNVRGAAMKLSKYVDDARKHEVARRWEKRYDDDDDDDNASLSFFFFFVRVKYDSPPALHLTAIECSPSPLFLFLYTVLDLNLT
jgi:hypothetical protein